MHYNAYTKCVGPVPRRGEEPGYEATKCVHCHRKKQTVFKNSNISFIANKQHFWLNCYNVLVWLVFMQSIHIPTCTEVLSLSPHFLQ